MLIGDAKEIRKTPKKEGYEAKRTSAEVRTHIPSLKEDKMSNTKQSSAPYD